MKGTTEGALTMERERLRQATSAWQRLCDCFGPQPTLSNIDGEGHNPACPFFKFVESDNAGRNEDNSC